MRIGRRIRDLIRAVALAAPRHVAARLQDRGESPERIEVALARAEARRRQLEENLAAAEQAGQEETARQARRQIEELARSTEGLRQTLDLLTARREAAARPAPAAHPAGVTPPTGLSEPDVTDDAAPAADHDLEARKRRLSGPG